ncbi:hypothetical protein [Halorarius litoreus]|uniref:hypothetical protein n=1 Tax=Halorarius litoreus TaxID=2962676 RepID=UPI0020CDD33A|nr:hypothetical protein [Halorarius litoreus]
MRSVLLVAVVVLAGCSGLGGVGGLDADSGGETPTLTPVPVVEPTPRDTPESTGETTLSPGIDIHGVQDPFAVAATHTTGLSNRSFRFVDVLTVRDTAGDLQYRTVRTAAVGTERFTLSRTVRLAPNASVTQPAGRFDLYSDGDRFVARFSDANETSYAEASGDEYVRQRELYNPPPYQGRLFAVFAVPEEWRVGRPGWKAAPESLQLIGYANETRPGPLGPGATARNLTVAAFVTDGVVTTWTVQYDTLVDGEPVAVLQSVRYTDIGQTTVSRPPWYDDAAE